MYKRLGKSIEYKAYMNCSLEWYTSYTYRSHQSTVDNFLITFMNLLYLPSLCEFNLIEYCFNTKKIIKNSFFYMFSIRDKRRLNSMYKRTHYNRSRILKGMRHFCTLHFCTLLKQLLRVQYLNSCDNPSCSTGYWHDPRNIHA